MLQYSYLQVMDFLTTIAFLMNGVQEANPIVRAALRYAPDPLMGLLFVKLVALGLGLYCWKMQKQRLLTRMNLFLAVVVAWNVTSMIVNSVPLLT
jgi:hypothetical protein